MLASQHRLRRPHEIERVYKRGRYGGAKQLHLKSLRTGLPSSRAVVVVGKKISKKAVVRNRIRRRLSDQLANIWQTLPAGYDIVVTVREDISDIPAEQLKSQLSGALIKAGLINTAK